MQTTIEYWSDNERWVCEVRYTWLRYRIATTDAPEEGGVPEIHEARITDYTRWDDEGEVVETLSPETTLFRRQEIAERFQGLCDLEAKIINEVNQGVPSGPDR